MKLDNFTKDHLAAWLKSQFPDFWEDHLSTALAFLEEAEEADREFWLDAGWPKLCEHLSIWDRDDALNQDYEKTMKYI